MKTSEFCLKYGYDRNAIAVAKNTGGSLSQFIDGKGVDEDKFISAKDFSTLLTNASHTLYYPMLDHFGTVSKLTRILSKITDRSVSSWNTFISTDLFHEHTNSYTYQEMRYEFVIVCAILFTILDLDKDYWIY